MDYRELLESAGARHGIPSGLMTALGSKESAFDPNAVSKAGARGLTQVMPATAAEMGYSAEQMQQPEHQADAGARYLAKMYQEFGNWQDALQAYHDGPGNVRAQKAGTKQMGPEGRQYVDSRFSPWTNGADPVTNNVPEQRATSARVHPQEDPDNPFAQLELKTAGEPAPAGEAPNIQSDENNPFFQLEQNGIAKPDSEQEQQQPGNPLLEAGKGLAQFAVNVANIPNAVENAAGSAERWLGNKIGGKIGNALIEDSNRPGLTDTIKSAGTWLGNQAGIGNGNYQPSAGFTLPESVRPQDEYAKIGAEMGPYLIPGVGAERTAAALGSVAGAGRAERFATKAADMLAENVPGVLAQNSSADNPDGLAKDLAIGTAASGAGRVIAPLFGKAAGAVRNRLNPAERALPSTNDEIVQAAKSRAGREDLNRAISQVSPEVDEAARVTGVDINALSPGQRSGNAGLQDVEGVLSSVAGPARDAQERGVSAVTSSLKNDLNRLGAEAGSSSEKTAAIRERVVNSLNSLKATERSAWDSMRNAANPLAKEKAANVRAHLSAEKALATFDNPTLKSLHKTSESPMTFEQMKEWRSRIGDSEEAARRAGKMNEARKLAGARNALADDMRGMAEKHGFIDDWEKANALSKERFAMEKDAKTAFGKSLDDDQFVSKLNTALRSSGEKGVNPIHKLVAALPEPERGVMLASALSRAVEKGPRGGTSVGAGMKDLSEILTPQNVAAIRRYLPQEADLLAAYGTLARNASGFMKRMEQTGRSMPSLKRLEEGVGGMSGAVMRASANRGLDLAIGGAAVATGGVGGAAVAGGKFLASQLLEKAIEKRSVKFIVEKAIQEGGNALKAGGSKAAIDAAEKRLMRNPKILAILNKEFSPDEVRAIRRMGIVVTMSGLEAFLLN